MEAKIGYDWHQGPIPESWFRELLNKPLMIIQKKGLLVGCVLRDKGKYFAMTKTADSQEVLNIGNDCIAFKLMKPA